MMRNDAIDLTPEILHALLAELEQSHAAFLERAAVAFRLAQFFEQRALDLENQQREIGGVLQRIYDIEQLYGK